MLKASNCLGSFGLELEYLEEMPAFNRVFGFSANQINRKLLGDRSELSKLIIALSFLLTNARSVSGMKCNAIPSPHPIIPI